MEKKANSLFFCLLVWLSQDSYANSYNFQHIREIKSERINTTSFRSEPRNLKKQENIIKVRSDVGPKPKAWCGWYMRTLFGGGPEYNRAIAWAKRGEPSEPKVGAIVVWPHHVGYISGYNKKGWLVTSGNDGNAVKTRPLNMKGVIAIRAV